MSKKLINKVEKSFISEFNTNPLMIFSPGRINLIGEHTDYNNGFVFPAAIDKGIVLAIEKSDNNYSKVISIDMHEELILNLKNLKKIKENTWKNYIIGVIAEILKKGKEFTNFNCVFAGNIPVGSGLSSSAALENSLALGCNELFNLGLSKRELIHISQKAEHNYVGVNCGIMDQYASMFGKQGHAIFLDCKTLNSELVPVHLTDYEVILVNSNVKHALAESGYNDRYAVCQKIIKLLNKPSLRAVSIEELNTLKAKISESDYKKGLYVLQENERVVACKNALKDNDIKSVGEILFQSHIGQSKMYDISCVELDFLVETAKENDSVIGSRMMGGGFGGCTINLVLKKDLQDFKTKVSTRYKEKFNKDCSIYKVKLGDGTRVIK
ncbi:galactokinase [Winogradskyella echinorum]|uniref:Galactokinase n=1 Tax=Winogradskyella echinorum TaxID=538189 RepID=A0ABR6XXZ3_9FLAO|nr:galactokinase [Winogradskyella echinorum]MBC3845346.1 galactokinase [Winogradskyella echinorum]MBC5749694.1 galactokinase [Winogradskyella echinorum]